MEAAGKTGGDGLCALVSWHDLGPGLGGLGAGLSAWAAYAGRVVVGAGVDGSRAKVRGLLPDPRVTVVVAGDRGRLGRVSTELAAAGLSARGRRLVLPGNCEVAGGLGGGVVGVLTGCAPGSADAGRRGTGCWTLWAVRSRMSGPGL